jgi:hypothetical protein
VEKTARRVRARINSAGVIGLCVGLLAIPIMSALIAPLWRTAKRSFRRLRGKG